MRGGSKNVRLLGTLTRNVLVSFVFSVKAAILMYFSLDYHSLHLHLAALIHGKITFVYGPFSFQMQHVQNIFTHKYR